jgi:hypothetical protein
VIVVEGDGAEPGNTNEVVAVRADLQAAQRPEARRKIVEVVVEGVVAFAQLGPGGVEQPDDRVGNFKIRGVYQRCGQHRHDIPSEQAADSDEVDITTTSGQEEYAAIRGHTGARGDLDRCRRPAVVGGLLVVQQRHRGPGGREQQQHRQQQDPHGFS